jgi:hypothetical protein
MKKNIKKNIELILLVFCTLLFIIPGCTADKERLQIIEYRDKVIHEMQKYVELNKEILNLQVA